MWIELHQTLPRHPKLARLANRLRVPRAQAAGHLTFLWLWALDYCPTGDLSALEPAEISAAADFGGDAELFVQALRDSGWVDEDGGIHDWHEYAGRIVTERAQAKVRMREYRERAKTKPERNGDVQAVTENVRVTQGERAGLPNSTLPNSTLSPPTGAGAGAESPAESASVVPDEAEVLAWADAWPGNLAMGIPPCIPRPWILGWMASRMVPNGRPLGDWRRKADLDFRADWLAGHPKARPKAAIAPKAAGGVPARIALETAVREAKALVARCAEEMARAETVNGPKGDQLRRKFGERLRAAEDDLAAAQRALAEVAA